MEKTSSNDLWEEIGSLDEEELSHVLAQLFIVYEEKLQINPGDKEASSFFSSLDRVISQVRECNANRR